MSLPATLRTTCIQKTCDFLISGVWEDSRPNPFSDMPVFIVQEFLSCFWPHEVLIQASIAPSRLLLASGRLERVDLPYAYDVEDYVPLLRMLSHGCQNLRMLSTPSLLPRRSINAERALHELLQNCPKLERLNSGIYFELNVLRNCKNLKALRSRFASEELTEMLSSRITSDSLQLLQSVEVFDLFENPCILSDEEELRVMLVILENCPQVTSLGVLDSSIALKELHDRSLGTPRQFHLRRCYWEDVQPTSQSNYCDKIRVAALSCPMVKTLSIDILHAGCLQHLSVLRNLRHLYISFQDPDVDYTQGCSFLLEVIGHQLTHLSLRAYIRDEPAFRLGVICGNCPNLSTLQLYSPMISDEGVQPCANLLHLKHLDVEMSDRQSLLFLLSNCLNLKVLCLKDCSDLDDGVMQAILQYNHFAELEVALINYCSLSELGWRSFLQRAPKLTKCCLRDGGTAMRCLRDLNPGAVSYPLEDFGALRKEYFPPSTFNW